MPGILARPNTERIFLYVASQPGDYNRYLLMFRRDSPLSAMMNAYCMEYDLAMGNVYFCYRGVVINGFDTPKTLGMQMNNKIDVLVLSEL